MESLRAHDGEPPCLLVARSESGTFTLQDVQSAIRNPPKACQRCNPPQSESAMRKLHNQFKPSELELRGPRNGLKIGPRSSRM
eukprot:9407538-Alexandrium_andersonii.AAC.1